ncbi:MAG: HAD hydrolase-like protein [Pseudomonadota bacterium]
MRYGAAEPAQRTAQTTRAVLFDLDGTLVDTMQVFADVAAGVMARHHGVQAAIARRRYLQTSGIPFFRQLEEIFPGDPRNALAASDFEARKVEATVDVVPSADTTEALARLSTAGLKVAVSSNNFQVQVDRFVSKCPVALDLAMGFGNGLAKGEPHFIHACRVFGLTRTDIVFVGDSLADAKLAQVSNVRFVARLGTFSAEQFRRVVPDVLRVDTLGELVSLLGC